MAISQIITAGPSGETIYTDTNIANAVVDGIKNSSAVIYYLTINNTLNAAVSYIKLFNVASGSVVVGTTPPDFIVYCPAGVITTLPFFTGSVPGLTFPTALSALCSTTGGTISSGAPAFAVTMSIAYV